MTVPTSRLPLIRRMAAWRAAMRSRKALFSRRRSLESRNEGGSFGVEVNVLGGRSPNPYLAQAFDPTIASQAMVLGGSRFARHPAGRAGC